MSTSTFAILRQSPYHRYLNFIQHHRRLMWWVLAVYLSVLIIAMLIFNISITPDRIAIALFVSALLLGQGWRFLLEWLPFIGLLLAYEGLRGFADFLPVHITDLIAAERFIANGAIPTIWLQQQLQGPVVSWLDIMGTILYFLHFPLPLFLAFWLWMSQRREYWRFVITLVLLCFAGFITYVLFPAMPPWLAAQQGYLPPVQKIIDQVLQLFPERMSVSYLYHTLNPNQVAAMPSLHAAWPWLVFLTLWRIKGRWALLFLPYCLALWFSIVYLGEHYIVDVIAGIIYAQVAFGGGGALVDRLANRLARYQASGAGLLPIGVQVALTRQLLDQS